MPRGPFDAARQWLLFAGAYYIYRIVRGVVDGHANVAFQHARDIVNFERSLHMFFESDVQQWATGVPTSKYVRVDLNKQLETYIADTLTSTLTSICPMLGRTLLQKLAIYEGGRKFKEKEARTERIHAKVRSHHQCWHFQRKCSRHAGCGDTSSAAASASGISVSSGFFPNSVIVSF